MKLLSKRIDVSLSNLRIRISLKDKINNGNIYTKLYRLSEKILWMRKMKVNVTFLISDSIHRE